MPEHLDLRGNFGLAPADAVRFFEAKGYRISRNGWSEMMHDDHRDFTIARVTDVDVLVAFKQSLLTALQEGKTEQTWRQETIAGLQSQGLWEKLNFSPRRMRVIYDTNLRMSRAAGQWQRIWAARASRPYLRYSAVMDRRTRPAHRDWHDTVLPVEHPWWHTHFPPNGWYCRCSVQQLSERDLVRYKLAVSPAPPPGGRRDFRAIDGRRYSVPDGIDPGFGYNVGLGEQDRLATKAATSFIEASRVGLSSVASRAFRDIINASLGGMQPTWAVEFDAAIAANDAEAIADLVDRVIKAGIARNGLADNVFGEKFRLAMADDNVRRLTVTEFARTSLAEPTYIGKLPIVDVTQAEVQAVKASTMADLSGARHVLDAEKVRHVRYSHGSAAGEARRGQIAITTEDYALIPEIVANASQIKLIGEPNSRKPQRIEYRAEIDGRIYVYTAIWAPKKRRLTLLTLYKEIAQ